MTSKKSGTFEQMGRSVDTGINTVKTRLTEAKESGMNMIRLAQKETTRIASSITTKAKKTLSNAEKYAAQQMNSAKEVLRANYSILQQKSQVVARSAQEILNKAGNLSAKAAYTMVGIAVIIGEKVKNIALDAKNGVIKVGLKTGEMIHINIVRPAINSINAGRQVVQNAYNSVKRQTKLTLETARQAMTRLENSINKTALNALSATKRQLSALGDAGVRTYNNILTSVKRAGNKGVEVAVASAQAVRDYGNKVSHAVTTSVNRVVVVTLTTGEKVSYEVNAGLKSAARQARQKQEEAERRGRQAMQK